MSSIVYATIYRLDVGVMLLLQMFLGTYSCLKAFKFLQHIFMKIN